jgi:hypothetical protein
VGAALKGRFPQAAAMDSGFWGSSFSWRHVLKSIANQHFLIYFAELCIQQWAGEALAAVPRDCSHSPIVFDLSFVPLVLRGQ